MNKSDGNALINQYCDRQVGKAGYRNDYDTNWNSLHDVIERVESEGYTVNIHKYSCLITDSRTNQVVVRNPNAHRLHNKITFVWLAVVRFITKQHQLQPCNS